MTFPTQRGVVCDPSLDGVSHLNVWSKAKTELGRSLTNMAPIGVKIDKVGYFSSIEGYWWYVATGSIYNDFLHMTAFEARRYGLTLKRVDDPDFKTKIKSAILTKLRSNPWILDELKRSDLPLTHYYVYGKEPDKCVVRPANNSLWVIDYLESLRGGRK